MSSAFTKARRIFAGVKIEPVVVFSGGGFRQIASRKTGNSKHNLVEIGLDRRQRHFGEVGALVVGRIFEVSPPIAVVSFDAPVAWSDIGGIERGGRPRDDGGHADPSRILLTCSSSSRANASSSSKVISAPIGRR